MIPSIKHTSFIPAILITGFVSLMSQVILLRELMIVFRGNELTLGLMLSIWLLGTAVGSGIVGRWAKKLKSPLSYFIGFQFAFALLLPLTIIFVRLNTQIWGILQGELISLALILFIPLIALLPICVLIGFLYTFACHIYHLITDETSTAVAKIYLIEAIGSGVASFIVSLILIQFLETFQLAVVICSANLIAAISLIYLSKKRSLLQKLFLVALVLILIIFIHIAFMRFDRSTLQRFWKNFEILHSETTIYGNIAVTRLGDSISFFENGSLMFSYPDLLYAEESVHFALLEHPDPRDILLIGGGVSGSLAQILQHPHVRHLDYVELDPKIVELSRRYLPIAELDDPRVNIIHIDARRFIKQKQRNYDVVIVNLPDPHTTLINRFYTIEFFQEVRHILNDHGVIGFSVTSSENVIGEDLANFLTCLYRTLASVFADIVLIPGDTNHFIGCVNIGVLTHDPQKLVQRLIERDLKTVYLREHYIPYRLSSDRVNYLTQRVIHNKYDKINHDFRPIGNFHNLVVWTTHFNPHVKRFFLFLNQIGFKLIFIISVLIVLLFLIQRGRKSGGEKIFSTSIIVSVIAIGFSGISLEVLIILAFQAIYGYVYFQLAIILSIFMIGLAGGSYFAIRRINQTNRIFSRFKSIQLLMVLYPLLLIGVLHQSAQISFHPFIFQIVFALLILLVGIITGYQYPLASHLFYRIKPQVEKVAGTIYASDLVGACVGALITSAILIPILGIFQTCAALSLLNFAVFLGLAMVKDQ